MNIKVSLQPKKTKKNVIYFSVVTPMCPDCVRITSIRLWNIYYIPFPTPFHADWVHIIWWGKSIPYLQSYKGRIIPNCKWNNSKNTVYHFGHQNRVSGHIAYSKIASIEAMCLEALCQYTHTGILPPLKIFIWFINRPL